MTLKHSWILGILLGLLSGAAHADGKTIVARTGGPELLPGRSPAPLYDEVGFRNHLRGLAARSSNVALAAGPTGRTDAARFGTLYLPDRDMNFAIDTVKDGGLGLHFDLDRDGDLNGAHVVKFDPRGEAWVATLDREIEVPGGETQRRVRLLADFSILAPENDEPPRQVLIGGTTLRRGQIALGQTEVLFAVRGRHGMYGAAHDVIYFDTDGDGTLNLESMRSGELFLMTDRIVTLGQTSYEFGVDSSGDTLRLTPLEQSLPARARLDPGFPAPDFKVRDIDGFYRTLAMLRGKVVLLYFWGTWCAPCRTDTPRLVALFETYHPQGFEILGVNQGDLEQPLRTYLKTHRVRWPQILQIDDGDVLGLYRVQHYPTTILIDREGNIVATDLRGDGLDSKVVELLADVAAAPR